MRASEMTIPSATGSAPPERPVPAPARDERQALVVADAHDRLHLLRRAGQRDERGTTRWPVSPSHSYVRSCSGSRITSVAAANRASASGVIGSESNGASEAIHAHRVAAEHRVALVLVDLLERLEHEPEHSS